MKFSVQENLAPGLSFREKIRNIASIGYEGIELKGSQTFGDRIAEIKDGLRDSGVSATCICGGYKFGLLFSDKSDRIQSMNEIKHLLALAVEVGAKEGVIIVPIFGKAQLPDLSPWKTALQLEEELLIEELSELADYAKQVGTRLILEPLNRYETHYLRRVDQAVSICEKIGSAHITVLADFFHMNIEEASIEEAIRNAGKWLGYVHLADSNRLVPGSGHTDFVPGFAALHELSYSGWLSLECGVPGNAEDSLRETLQFLKGRLKSALLQTHK